MIKKSVRKDCLEAEDLMRVIRENIDSDRGKAMAAFGNIYYKYNKVLWTICVKVCGDNPVADKVFTTTWKKIMNHPDYNYTEFGVTFETWMSSIAKNAWIDTLKKEVPLEDKTIDDCIEAEEGVVEEDVVPSFEAELIERALEELTEKERDILKTYILYDTNNKKHVPDEILDELRERYQTTSVNLRKIKSRALEKVQDYVKKYQ